MPTGRPSSVKCPKCMRGKWGQEPSVKGVRIDWSRTHMRTKRSIAKRGLCHRAKCLDCGHEWWTSLSAPPPERTAA